jgi:adenylate cyclase
MLTMRWSRLKHARDWLQSLKPKGRLSASVHEAEQAGLVFAFRARCAAIAVVAAYLLLLVPWPRDAYYLALASGFFVLGYVPFRFRRHRLAEPIKLFCVMLDVVLITAAILIPPPAGLSLDWPVQTRIRGQEFLYLLLLLAEAALTYSPRRVLWTGASIAVIWSVGFRVLYDLPDTKRLTDLPAGERFSDADILVLYLNPYFVGLTQWRTQLVATTILTILLVAAVLRSRMHLLAELQAQVVRSDLARYVSPDIADALAEQASSGFGEPAIRNVAVLFADIVGFSSTAERLPPERTFALLRSFRERSSRSVFRQKGTLDKYLGDGLMATFGALQEEHDAAARAIACAIDLQEEIERWNAKRLAQAKEPVRIAVGVHFGSVIVGNLGSEHRVEFTVVGDVVNVASRLEEATRDLRCTLAISDVCVRAAGAVRSLERFTDVVEVQLRGRSTPLLVHISGVR